MQTRAQQTFDPVAQSAEPVRALDTYIHELQVNGKSAIAKEAKKLRDRLVRQVRKLDELERMPVVVATSETGSGAFVLEVELGIHTVSEANTHQHHMKKHRERGDIRPTVAMAMRANANRRALRIKPPCVVRLVRIGVKQLDDDNLRGALKAVRDGVADWLGTDDSERAGITWQYGQELCKPMGHGVRIEVRV